MFYIELCQLLADLFIIELSGSRGAFVIAYSHVCVADSSEPEAHSPQFNANPTWILTLQLCSFD